MRENYNRYMCGLIIGMCGEYLYRVGYLIYPLIIVICCLVIMIADFVLQYIERKKVLKTYKWIDVKKYKDEEDLSWEERYKKLEQHHIEETTFLIDKIREKVK